MDFKTFLIESDEKHAVMSYGRFNPVTTGHEKLMHKVHDVAKKVGGDAHVIASHSEGDDRNPIPKDKKIGYIKKVAKPGTKVSSSDKEHPSILHQAVKLHDQGVKHLHIVGGSDRVEGFHKMLNTYNGKKGLRHGHYDFKSITKHSSGERDPDSKDVSGMSGTKMRQHARSGDMKSFKSGLPKVLHPHAEEMANHIKAVPEKIKKAKKIKEEYKYEWGTPEGTRYMKKLTPGENKNKETEVVFGEVNQDSDIKDRKGTQPAKYHSGLSKSTKEKRDAQFKKQTKMDDRDPAAYKLAPGDKTAKTKPSVHTIAYKKKFGEESIPMLCKKWNNSDLDEQYPFKSVMMRAKAKISPSYKMAKKELQNKVKSDPSKPKVSHAATIAKKYDGVDARTLDSVTEQGKGLYYNINKKRKEGRPMRKKGESGAPKPSDFDRAKTTATEEVVTIEEQKGLSAKAAKSGVSLSTLKKVYNRGMAAWKTGHRPGTTPQQWAMARVNSYINKGKGTYHGADKDLREHMDLSKLTEQDTDQMVDELTWEDIVDFYDDNDFHTEEVNEALSTQARLKRRQTFARFRGKRGIAKGLKLRRASDMKTLQRRAKLAARRALYGRFLRGRNKASLSAAEKDRLEKQVGTLKTLQTSLAQKMLPKIRGIEQKRLAGYRSKKK